MTPEAKTYIRLLKDQYIQNQTQEQIRQLLIEENNIERSTVKGYHGREIFELLQNADDAYQKSINEGHKPENDLQVTIEYKNNILKITNTGTVFDKKGICAIVQGNNSNKTGKYVGNKGTGFRSVLNWATKVRIYSGEYNIEFSEEIAKKEFEQIKTKPQIEKQIKDQKENGKPELYIPMLEVPVYIDEKKEYNKQTTVEVTINPKKINDNYSPIKQLEEIDLKILMFLPNLRQIKIITENKEIIYKSTQNQNKYHLQKIVNNHCEIEEDYTLFSHTVSGAITEDNTKKDVYLSIAVPSDFADFNSDLLYAYFPLLHASSPFNCILHATYDLGQDRNTIVVGNTNKTIIQAQLNFLIDVAQHFIDADALETVYQILIPKNFNTQKNAYDFAAFADSQSQLEEHYWNKLCSLKMFKTVNGEKISFNDNPVMLETGYPTFFKGKHFSKLLAPFNNDNLLGLIKFLEHKYNRSLKYDEDKLLDAVNHSAEGWGVSEKVKAFVWWNKQKYQSLPKLIQKADNTYLSYKEKCDILDGNFKVPFWVNFSTIREDYKNKLFEEAVNFEEIKRAKGSDTIPALICQKNIFSTVDFHYCDKNGSVSEINNSISTFEQALDFVNWLWKNYGHDNIPESLLKIKNYNFPCIKGKNHFFQNSNKIFLGKDYQNNLAEKLFDSTYASFPAITSFKIDKNDADRFQEFIEKFGITKYPKIENKTIQTSDNGKVSEINTIYYNFYKEKIEELTPYNRIQYIEYNGPVIENLEKILSIPTEHIINWIYQDRKLYNHLLHHFEISGQIKYLTTRQYYDHPYDEAIKNYILEIFNNTKWIQIGKMRYSPKEVLSDSRNNRKFIALAPCMVISSKDVAEEKKDFVLRIDELHQKTKIPVSEINKILQLFDFKENVTELSSEKFYEIMLKLPNLEEKQKAVELSKIINNIVEQPNFERQFENSNNQTIFFREGKILVKYKNDLMYHLASKAYLPSNNIINKKETPIVEKSPRTNNEHFITLFGCKKYDRKYKIKEDSIKQSPANEKFQKYFKEFKKYAKYYENQNANLRDKRFSITLVSDISVTENNEIRNVEEEYNLISDNSAKWYIKIINDDYDLWKLSGIIKDIYTLIANTPGFNAGKIGELFRTEDDIHRRDLLEEEFGKLPFDESEDIRKNFLDTLKKLKPTYNTGNIKINFDDFEDSYAQIINLFKSIGVDIADFNHRSLPEYAIDLRPFFMEQAKNFISNQSETFKNVLYSKALNNENLQHTFLDTIENFKNFQLDNAKNTVNFDVKKKIKEIFGDWKESEVQKRADDGYKENYYQMNPDDLYGNEISGNKDVQRMIYFAKEDEFKNWLTDTEKKSKEISQTENKKDHYEEYRNTIPEKSEISYSGKPFEISAHRRATSSCDFEKKHRSQKIQGNRGELLIYNLLCEDYGKENVYPISEAFVALDILKSGQEQSGEYDLSYKNKEGKTIYVEVKTGHNNTFIISSGELEFAKQHPNNYELYFVYNLETSTPRYYLIDKCFWKSKKYFQRIKEIEFHF